LSYVSFNEGAIQMPSYFTQRQRAPEETSGLAGVPLRETLLKVIAAAHPGVGPAKSVELYYVRQTTGSIGGKKVVGYYSPEFTYVIDVGKPRLAAVAIPYEMPLAQADGSLVPVGRGDGDFPQFAKATVFSAASNKSRDILFPAVAGSLLIGAREGVEETELKVALKEYVAGLENAGPFYVAKVAPFEELDIARKIQAEVTVVRYAELHMIVGEIENPWWVDRVL
jgi:hypothetical protein